jgi:hypothetical protein
MQGANRFSLVSDLDEETYLDQVSDQIAVDGYANGMAILCSHLRRNGKGRELFLFPVLARTRKVFCFSQLLYWNVLVEPAP